MNNTDNFEGRNSQSWSSKLGHEIHARLCSGLAFNEMRSTRDNFIESSIYIYIYTYTLNVKRVDVWHWQINFEINKKWFFSIINSWYEWYFRYSWSSTRVDIPSHLRSDLSENSQIRWNPTKMQKDWYQIQANVNSAEEMWTREAIFCLKLWTEVKVWSLYKVKTVSILLY